MKKRAFSLLLAVVMLLSVVLTSCSSDDEDDSTTTTTQKDALYLTLYAITEESTTDEAVALVQEALNKITESRFKTSLELRFYTKAEYQNALDSMLEEFAEKEERDAQLAKIIKSRSKAESAFKSKLDSEQRRAYEKQLRLDAKEQARIAKQKEQERLDRIEAGIEEPPAPIQGPQMDILYIDGYEEYIKYIDNKMLAPLDEYLKLDQAIIKQYISPAIIEAARVDGKVYGISTNLYLGDSEYMILNRSLVEKYEIDLDVTKAIYQFEPYLQLVAANEEGVIPIVRPVHAPDKDFMDYVGSTIEVASPEHSVFNTSFLTLTFSDGGLISHFERMTRFRELGYFAESEPTEDDVFFMDVRTLTPKQIKEWEEKGYIVKLYRRHLVKSDEDLVGLFGVSSKSKYPARAMEIIRLITTDDAFHNLFTYGIENLHYKVNSDGTATKISDDYSMDYFKTGNIFIGYMPEELGNEYKTEALVSNLNVKLYAFNNIRYELKEEQQELLDRANEIVAGAYEQLTMGLVEDPTHFCDDITAQLNQASLEFYNNTHNVPVESYKYLTFANQVILPALGDDSFFSKAATGSAVVVPYLKAAYESYFREGFFPEETVPEAVA